MNLQTRLALKNYKLLEREAVLRELLQQRINTQSKPAHLLLFLIAPFCAGMIFQQLSRRMSRAQMIGLISPLASMFLKV